jgi:hypothetical protein
VASPMTLGADVTTPSLPFPPSFSLPARFHHGPRSVNLTPSMM